MPPFEVIERYLTDHGGAGGFLVLVVLKIGEYIWGYVKSRDQSLNDLKCALEKNTAATVAMQAELSKFKTDLRKAFIALKKVSGDKWAEIAREFDDLTDH